MQQLQSGVGRARRPCCYFWDVASTGSVIVQGLSWSLLLCCQCVLTFLIADRAMSGLSSTFRGMQA